MILIPLPLFGASTVYSVAGFSVWVIIGIIWAFCSAFAVVLYPLWESRAALLMILKGMVKVSVHFLRGRDELYSTVVGAAVRMCGLRDLVPMSRRRTRRRLVLESKW